MIHRVLPLERVSPVQMLRALRDQPGLAALLGDWHGGDAVVALRPVRVLAPAEDPFAVLEGDAAQAPPASSPTLRFGGGWIGYLGYQLARDLEALAPPPVRAAALPRHHLAYYDHVLRHEAATGRWVCEALPGADPARVERTVTAVTRALAGAHGPRGYRCGPFAPDATGGRHASAVRRTLEHIRDGDVFQANICRGLEAEFHGDPLDLFCAGHERLRPRFAAFLRTPAGAVASLSPELFLRRTGRTVLTSPIKGTAPASSDPAQLHASAKNRAENVMIVDLMRNDLSRACVPGSVLAPAAPRVEPHTGVHHLVADVLGTVRPDVDDAALLRATFPPGSCTGAPKIRAMDVVNALEPTARGVYTGAIGYAGSPAGLCLNVAIRTFEFSGATVRLGVGGGIVADSDPAEEVHETLVKAAPLLAAVGAHFGPELEREWRGGAGGDGAAQRGTGIDGANPDGAVAGAPDPDRADPDRADTDGAGSSVRMGASPDPARGVFTTLRVCDGTPESLERHLARLGDSVRACYGQDLPASLGADVTHRAGELQGLHRLRITAVPGPRGLEVTLTVAALDPPPPASSSSPAGASTVGTGGRPGAASTPAVGAPGTAPAHRAAAGTGEPWLLVPAVLPGGLGRHKWADRGRLEELPGPWSPTADPLLTEPDGTVLETGRANVFAVTAHGVWTPPADGRILPGVVRARVLEALAGAGYPVLERSFTLEDLADATEVFVSNALRGVRPVRDVAGVGRWEPGPVALALPALLGWT